jgi:hypothetical protein
MRLTKAQREQLLDQQGIWVTAACDRCGNLLGAVRWTSRGEEGEWCSELCRRAGTKAERRRGGRPRLKLSAKCRVSHRRRQVREAVERHRLGVIKNCPQPHGNKRLAEAKIASLVSPPYPVSSTVADGTTEHC